MAEAEGDGTPARRRWPPIGRRAVVIVYCALFNDVMQAAIRIPLFRRIVDSVEPDPELVSPRIGQVSSIAALVETIMSPLSGALSDRFGRRKMMMVSTLGSSCSAFVLANARTFPQVIAGRVVNSVSGSSASVAQAFIADVTTQVERPDYMILVTALIGVAFTLGPVIGGWLNNNYGLGNTCLVSTAVAFMNFILVSCLMKESRKGLAAPTADGEDKEADAVERSPAAGASGQQPVAASTQGQGPAQAAAAVAENEPPQRQFSPMIWVLFTASMFVSPLSVVFEVCANVFLTDKFCDGDKDRGAQLFSKSYSCIGISLLVMPLFVYKPLKNKIGFTGTIVLGGITGCLGLVLNALAPTPWLFLSGTLLWAVGFQLLGPAVPVLITRLAAPTAFGKAFGLYRSFGNIGRVIAPTIVAPIFKYNRPLVFFFMAGGVIMMAVILYIVATASASSVTKPTAREVVVEPDMDVNDLEPEQESEAMLKKHLFGRQGSVASDVDLLQYGNLEGQVLTFGRDRRRLMRRSVSEEYHRAARPMLMAHHEHQAATEMSKTFHPS